MLLQFKIILSPLIFHLVHSDYEDFDMDSITSDESCNMPDGTGSESNCYCYSQPETDFEYSICAKNKCLLDDSRYQLINGKCFYFEKETKNFLDARENCKKKGGRLYEPKDVVALKKIAKIAGNSIVNHRDAWIGILDSSTGHPGSVKEGTYVFDSNSQNIKFNLRRYSLQQWSYKCIQVYISIYNVGHQGQVLNEHCSRIRPSICEL